jgi:hypothetical protein
MKPTKCEVVEAEELDARGRLAPAVRATCSRCGHTTVSFGTDEKSRKRCLALMREGCPRDEENFYVDDNVGGYQNLMSSGKAPRGREVPTPAVLLNKPLKPPGRS